MATKAQVKKFIDTLAPLIVAECEKRGYNYPSAIIAQSALESAWGTSTLASKYNNYFGMKCGSGWKGASVNMKTKEEYTKGTLTDISANFRAYESIEKGIEGYFDFIKYARYGNLKSATSSEDYIEKIKADGWATSSVYAQNIVSIINANNLKEYDKIFPNKTTTTESVESDYEIYKVVRGDSLWTIARKKLGNALRWNEIQRLNNLNSTLIVAGQTLKIPRK